MSDKTELDEALDLLRFLVGFIEAETCMDIDEQLDRAHALLERTNG